MAFQEILGALDCLCRHGNDVVLAAEMAIDKQAQLAGGSPAEESLTGETHDSGHDLNLRNLGNGDQVSQLTRRDRADPFRPRFRDIPLDQRAAVQKAPPKHSHAVPR